MNEESASIEQIDWFHELASLPLDQLALQANQANRNAFTQFVNASLVGGHELKNQSPEAFATTVHELRQSEHQWNQALCSALIKAKALQQSQGAGSAATFLESFASSCPWKLFREVAESQAAKFGSQP